jgi:hypothetical protein
MCRAKGEGGGRRCLGCQAPEALAKHNERRRKNRAIKRNAADWARQNGCAADEVAQLEAANPKDVKEWLRAKGQNPNDFVDGVPAQQPAGGRSPVPVGAAPVGGPAPAPRPAPVPAPAPAPVPAAPRAPRRRAGGGGGAGAAGGGAGDLNQILAAQQRAGRGNRAWSTPELDQQISTLEQLQGTHRDERSLLNGKPEKATKTKGGTNGTVRVELDNGVTGYFKPFAAENRRIAKGFGQDSRQQGIHEAAAWQLANRMGPPWSEMVPPVVIREMGGEVGSFALERPGKTGNHRPWDTGEWREGAFFDALIGQQDRHHGNFLVSGDRLALIDHGYTFARPGDYQNYSWLQRERLTTDSRLTYAERDVLNRLVASGDLLGLRKVLQPARADALEKRAQAMLRDGTLCDSY